MPRYVNKSKKPIYLTRDNIVVHPDETVDTLAYYDDIPELELVDIKPYVSPIILSETVTLNDTDYKEYNVFSAVRIYVVVLTGQIKLYLHEHNDNGDNTILLLAGMNYEINNRHKFLRQIFIENADSNQSSQYYIALYSNQQDYF
jgi:hypothetical protein